MLPLKKSYVIWLWLLLLPHSSVLADDSPFVEAPSMLAEGLCLRALEGIDAVLLDGAKGLGGYIGMHSDPQARLPRVSSFSSTDVHLETARSVFFQILPGQIKDLRGKMSTLEVDSLLKAVRIRVAQVMQSLGYGQERILIDFKTARITLESDRVNSSLIQNAIDLATTDLRKRVFQSHPQLVADLDAGGPWIIASSAESEYLASIAAKLGEGQYTTFEAKKEKARDSLLQLRNLAEVFFTEATATPSLAHLVESRGPSLNFNRRVFLALRKHEVAEGMLLFLAKEAGITIREAIELGFDTIAETLIELKSYLRIFIPPPQYSDSSSSRQAWLVPTQTNRILTVDIRGVGANLYAEVMDEVLRIDAHHLDDPSYPIERILTDIKVEKTVEWLERSLSLAMQEVIKREGDRILGVWATGDEFRVYLSGAPQEAIRWAEILGRDFRVSEAVLFEGANQKFQGLLPDLADGILTTVERNLGVKIAERLALSSRVVAFRRSELSPKDLLVQVFVSPETPETLFQINAVLRVNVLDELRLQLERYYPGRTFELELSFDGASPSD